MRILWRYAGERKNPIWIATSLSLLAMTCIGGCANPARVQRDYVAMRDQCRSYAESQEGQYVAGDQQIDDRGRGAVLATLFSDCMYEMGWTVATPPRDGGGNGNGGGIIDTAREKPQARNVTPGTAPEVGNVTLQPSPLPMSPTETGNDVNRNPYRSTQFPNSTYQSVPTPALVDKKTKTGGVGVVTPKRESPRGVPKGIQMKTPSPAAAKTTTTPALTEAERKSILDNLNDPD